MARVRRVLERAADGARNPAIWACVFVVFVALQLAWLWQLNRDTQQLAQENRRTTIALRAQGQKLTEAIEHQCKTDLAHDIAVREFIRVTKDLDTLSALVGLHLLLVDVRTCKEVSG